MLDTKWLFFSFFRYVSQPCQLQIRTVGHTAGCKDILLIQNKGVRVISSARYLDNCNHFCWAEGSLSMASTFCPACVTWSVTSLSSLYKVTTIHIIPGENVTLTFLTAGSARRRTVFWMRLSGLTMLCHYIYIFWYRYTSIWYDIL